MITRRRKLARSIALILLLGLFICSCGSKTYTGEQKSDDDKIIVAVLYFERNSDIKELEPYRTGLTDMFITKLKNMPELRVIEREKLDKIISEFELAETGAIDPETAQKIGRLLGAQALYYGSFTAMGKQICLNGHFTRVETAEILFSEGNRCEISDKNLFNMVDKVANTISAKVKANHKELVADLYFSKGKTAEENNDKDSAIQYYQQALMYSPAHKSSQKALARLKS
jgi:TolB-like protein